MTPKHICLLKNGIDTLIPFPEEWIGKQLSEVMPELGKLISDHFQPNDKCTVMLWRKNGDTDYTIKETDEIFVPFKMKQLI